MVQFVWHRSDHESDDLYLMWDPAPMESFIVNPDLANGGKVAELYELATDLGGQLRGEYGEVYGPDGPIGT